MKKIIINAEQQRYVIDSGESYTCFGFANARDHANLIAHRLGRADLAFTNEACPTLAGHGKYCHAVDAWRQLPLTRTTYFDPGTDAQAAKVMESCRRHERSAWPWATRTAANPGWKSMM